MKNALCYLLMCSVLISQLAISAAANAQSGQMGQMGSMVAIDCTDSSLHGHDHVAHSKHHSDTETNSHQSHNASHQDPQHDCCDKSQCLMPMCDCSVSSGGALITELLKSDTQKRQDLTVSLKAIYQNPNLKASYRPPKA